MRDYLLSTTHTDGRFKARFFLGRGYDAGAPWRLAADLRGIALTGRVAGRRETPWGSLYRVDGSATAPDGAAIDLTTVWIIGTNDVPRLVTAYPQRQP